MYEKLSRKEEKKKVIKSVFFVLKIAGSKMKKINEIFDEKDQNFHEKNVEK
jgi:hypothetical protein